MNHPKLTFAHKHFSTNKPWFAKAYNSEWEAKLKPEKKESSLPVGEIFQELFTIIYPIFSSALSGNLQDSKTKITNFCGTPIKSMKKTEKSPLPNKEELFFLKGNYTTIEENEEERESEKKIKISPISSSLQTTFWEFNRDGDIIYSLDYKVNLESQDLKLLHQLSKMPIKDLIRDENCEWKEGRMGFEVFKKMHKWASFGVTASIVASLSIKITEHYIQIFAREEGTPQKSLPLHKFSLIDNICTILIPLTSD